MNPAAATYGFPQGPSAGHPTPDVAWVGSTGNVGGSSNYVPPPPPASGGPSPTPDGFGSDRDNRRMWRNGLIAVGSLIAACWFVIWLLGALAEWLVDWVPTDVDVALGEENWQQLAPPETHCTDPGPQAYVDELTKPLLAHAGDEFEFQFVVVESPEVNAFALPGGFVTVNMGLLDAAETGEEVAAVLGHEMTHVTERHGMRGVMRKVGGLVFVAMIFGGTDYATLAYAVEGLAGQAHSRDQERQADEGGRAMLMAAGINPIGMATFFERLEADQGELPGAVALLSTHPNPGERAETTRAIAAGFVATVDLPDPPADLHCH
ncbi:M48 family metallopeptidase [Nannocystaceae bacterium ST9]